jgi:hypothetical protein
MVLFQLNVLQVVIWNDGECLSCILNRKGKVAAYDDDVWGSGGTVAAFSASALS